MSTMETVRKLREASGIPILPLGTIVATPGALALFEGDPTSAGRFIARHAAGDWGDVCPEDWEENEHSLTGGFRILSTYTVNEQKLWIITEADRSVTTLLLPEEY